MGFAFRFNRKKLHASFCRGCKSRSLAVFPAVYSAFIALAGFSVSSANAELVVQDVPLTPEQFMAEANGSWHSLESPALRSGSALASDGSYSSAGSGPAAALTPDMSTTDISGVLRTAIPYTGGRLTRLPSEQDSPFSTLLQKLQLPLMFPVAGGADQHATKERWAPALAAGWTLSQDRQRIGFRVNPDAIWSDGYPVTTADVAFTFRFLTDKSSSTPWLIDQLNHGVGAVEIHNDTDFSLSLTQPLDTETMHQLAALKLYSHRYWRQSDIRYDNKGWHAEPTTGPYYISRLVAGERITLSRNERWFGDELPMFAERFRPAKINIYLIPNEAAGYDRLRKGDIDYLEIVSHEHSGQYVADVVQQQPINQVDVYRYANASTNSNTKAHAHTQGGSVTAVWSCLLIRPEALTGTQADQVVRLAYSSDALPVSLQDQLARETRAEITTEQRSTAAVLSDFERARVDMAWLEFESLESPASYLASRMGISSAGVNCELHQSTHKSYLAWDWVLPVASADENAEHAPAAPVGYRFDPLDIQYGGWMVIDARKKSDILSRRKVRGHGKVIPIGAGQ
ncbi:ABC transporter substrate-binding protein [Oceanobacter kriegii]|uniref:ABC transporter substrate-binding protein n=1 Tax=Oceanobacter kriegii TaxID=64972 RepID=UPI000409B666|nr:ABC transporter substrate-binding protein [Oceanobacter kriegii]